MTDRLDLANAIAAAGIERKAAETIASTIFDAIRENVATKADLQQAESALRTDMAGMQAELKADIAAVHAGLKADIAALRAELKADVAAVHTELRETEQRLEAQINRMVIRLGGLAVVLWGLLVAALHLWPPHG
jgi:phage host-nuclease inhibitor protein Gam